MITCGKRRAALGAVVVGCLAIVVVASRAGFLPFHTSSSLARQASTGLVCEESDHDFGARQGPEASTLQHEFVLKNTSPRAVRILRRTTSCGCTSTDIPSEPIGPNGTLRMLVRANWGDRDGPQRAIVSLITDDRNTPVVQLTVRAYISTAFSVAPSSLDFGDLPPGPSNELTFEVIPRSDSIPLFITDVRASSPEIQVRRLGSNGDHQAPPRGPDRFAVSIDTPRERGPLGGQIFISTSTVPNRAVIRVRGRALGAIVAKPESLLFDFRSNSLPQTAELLLRLPGLTESVNVNVVIDPAPVGGQSLRVGEILSQNTNGDPTATVRVHCGGATKPISDSIVRIRVGAEEIHVPVFILGNQR